MSDTPFNNVAFDMPKSQSSSIKVIGVGGGGSNAVNHMFTQDIKGVDFVICNTDAQALQNSPVPNKIQLGVSLTSGLGAGANPEVGEKAAQESIEEIQKMLTSQTKMVFITAGMGGGTGTGAAPIIAGIAKKMDILTVGIVTMPFQFEGRMRAKQAQKGIDELRENVDSLIVINNNKLREVYGNLGFKAGFSKADEVLSTASRGIAEVITHHYKQNIDLHDAKTVLSNSGTAIMGSSKEAGENRAQNAIKKALDSPLLNDNKIRGAKNVLLLIVSGADEVTLDEIGEINDFIQEEAGYEANIIMGVGEDESLGDAIAVTVVATGFAIDQQRDITNTEVKKVYHTLNNEQTAHYNFEDEQTIVRPRTTRIIEEPIEEKKVVHQLLEEEPEEVVFTPKKQIENELIETTSAVENIEVVFDEVKKEVEEIVEEEESYDFVSEDDFVINDITPNLFSELDEEPVAKVNVFDLPVNSVVEVKKEEPINIFDIPVIDAEEIKYEAKEEVFNVFDLPVIDAEEVVFERKEIATPKKTVYVLEDEEEDVNEIEVVEAKEISAKPIAKQEESLSGIKRYTLDQFDVQPTIKNSSSLEMKKKIEEIEVNDVEEIRFQVREPKQMEVIDHEEVSPLNLTISEVQRSAEKRKNTFKKYNHRFKTSAFNEDVIDDIEKEPAYKRLGLELHSKQDVNNKSRTSIDVDKDNEVTIRKNNSFLHDNVD
ncbi:cell division protein FtsZ [Wenyingzhuangia marina]|uniref:Cell division protein FtsZ n=1 Tax=Wenyingzhuangia marina TaxID=1195760 RepID=A0A1M5SFN3_9FLAO|nr:cell division protein FtsZ [Wenyingzhuangia marina]GGF62058.1 cell division protein FtsZ [Wenyingzhuangia marina]SHH37354.1 cell division protein FtsZ [Wenyingzhuangia marina]